MHRPYTRPTSLAASSALSEYYVPNFISPLQVITALNRARVRFMLVGLHGIGGWLQEPRATEDVDVLVGPRGHKKAVRALLEAFPHLEEYDLPVVTRLREPESKKVVIGVMKPNRELFREALRFGPMVRSGGQPYQIPSLELALAMKFAPVVSLYRQDKDKYQDAHDFIAIVEANPNIDLDKLATLGELVDAGGGKAIVEMVRRVRAKEKLLL